MLCGCPSDGLEPSVLNHLGFLIKDWDPFVAKLRAAGLTMKNSRNEPTAVSAIHS